MRTIRIAAGQGFWGDWLEAPIRQARLGQIDYLMLDYLAEVTMSVLAKQRAKNPAAGYARDFVTLIRQIAPDILQKRFRVIANAGGMNPRGCAEEIRGVLESLGLAGAIRIAVVDGDDLTGRLGELTVAGAPLTHLETHAPLSSVSDRIISANAYLGSAGLVEALETGASIIITGRVADPSLVVAPLVHEFGWSLQDWDKLAGGTVAGHIIECGAQSSGGNFSADWTSVTGLADIGFPIVEVSEDATFVVTKHPGTGGLVDARTVTEQLVYEIGDPENYYSPDVIADFTHLRLQSAGENRIFVSGARGKPRPNQYKVSISYADGYMAHGTMVYSWPDAVAKARAAAAIVAERLRSLGLQFDRVHSEIIGVDACHGPKLSGEAIAQLPEVMLRIGVRGQNRSAVERFTREIAPLVLGGPPSATGYAGGKQDVREVYAYWPALVDRELVTPVVTVV